MDQIWEYLSAYLTVDNVAVTLALVGTCVFSVLAACAQQKIWNKTRHIPHLRRQQQFITEARGHLR